MTTAAATWPQWAADQIGKRYEEGADGPDAYCCWGLVRVACIMRHGVLIPVAPDNREQSASVAAKCQSLGWRRVDQAFHGAGDGDVVLMRNAEGRPHAGIAIAVGPRIELLHAQYGGVVRQPLLDMHLLGFHSPQVWRWLP